MIPGHIWIQRGTHLWTLENRRNEGVARVVRLAEWSWEWSIHGRTLRKIETTRRKAFGQAEEQVRRILG